MTGVTGSFFRALAVTMTVALLTSLALALTWTPALSLVLLRDRKKQARLRARPAADAPAEEPAWAVEPDDDGRCIDAQDALCMSAR